MPCRELEDESRTRQTGDVIDKRVCRLVGQCMPCWELEDENRTRQTVDVIHKRVCRLVGEWNWRIKTGNGSCDLLDVAAYKICRYSLRHTV